MDVYLLALHEPYRAPDQPVEINATVVHADTLRHPRLPQPDGGRIYRCLKEFPGRTDGCVVPLSTLTHELDGGELWPEIGDWERVTDAVVALTRDRGCGAIPLGVPPVMAASLANGPKTSLVVHGPDGATELGERDRARYLDEVTAAVADTVTSSGRLWPGDGLIEPPRDPQHLPYRPARERP